MIQQINLYKDILEQKHRKSLLSRLPLIFSALLISLLGYSLYEIWLLHSTNVHIELTRQQLSSAEAKANSLLSMIPAQALDNNLAAEVQTWNNNLNDLTHTIQVLNTKNPDNSTGFSPYFSALANQSIAEVWLTNIHITGQPKHMVLSGSTFKPAKIPHLIQNLHQEPIFLGQNFAQLNITPHGEKDDSRQIDFKLNSNFVKAETTKDVR